MLLRPWLVLRDLLFLFDMSKSVEAKSQSSDTTRDGVHTGSASPFASSSSPSASGSPVSSSVPPFSPSALPPSSSFLLSWPHVADSHSATALSHSHRPQALNLVHYALHVFARLSIIDLTCAHAQAHNPSSTSTSCCSPSLPLSTSGLLFLRSSS